MAILQSNDEPLYRPLNPEDSATFRFLARINAKLGLSLKSYEELQSCLVDTSALPPSNPAWFSEAKLSWAENMLHCRSDTKLAFIQATEPTPDFPSPELQKCTYLQLYNLVADLASALLLNGLEPGDRVGSYSSNCIENVVACLATAAVGGIWVSAAADFGPEGVLERFEQVQPKFIFAVDAVVYNAKVHRHTAKLSVLLSGLSKKGITPSKVIIIHTIPHPEDRGDWLPGWISWDSFLADGGECKLGRTSSGEIEWRRGPFDTPLWILFSSGTTGRPKPIVHRAGGMLLQAKKEFAICGDLKPEDVFFYYTTTGWMMWNFLVSGLSLGSTLVLYDGSPLRDPSYLWKLVDELGITIYGTSAKYIDHLSKVYRPREHHDLSTLRHIYSTGSPLAPPLFDYVYRHIRKDVLLGSITGGTDICSLFAGMCSALPVYRGEIQCRMLGMAVESFSPSGTLCAPDEPGELVCVKPFPCMPLGFWPLPGFAPDENVKAASYRYQQAYFSDVEGVWYHGDHIIITRSRCGNGGGLVMLGRSDGVLNPGGIRFGSSELYDVLDLCFSGASAEQTIVDSLAVGQKIDGGADERVILFVKLPEGHVLSADLEQKIKTEVRNRRSPRHVPARIIQTADIPYTLNGKRVEVLVKKIINGAPLSTVNPATLANPECLAFYAEVGAALRLEVGAK
ncbi:putative acetyl-coenzyme A synthetase N-terminus [Lyophyllum shimeji]|uniref:Acetyl-coenzyme A synthetase N-terminus n=1 Tax=Lyophyllum shimeji TaxID=47721 RepID=A0A9P3UJW4_LYOSH|nr:putative acetyl-coenzyme A synthetase N-terminus [Lyophyllum shimeji]